MLEARTVRLQKAKRITNKMTLAAYAIPEKIFFKIGEVCDLVGVQPHVLRYWETEFPMLSPQKNRAGQRTYRRRDVEISLRIKELLYEELYTIAGAKKKLSSELREQTKLKVVPSIEPMRSDKPELKADVKNENEYNSTIIKPIPVYSPAPAVRKFAPTFVEDDEEVEADFTTDEFEADEISDEKKSALLTLRKQLGELMLMLERHEEAPRQIW